MDKIRNLRPTEIDILQSQGCRAENWDQVFVPTSFETEHLSNAHFSGTVILGVFEKEFTLPGGIKKHSGIRNATLHNCILGNNILVENIHNYIANYRIKDNCFIENVNVIMTEGVSSFGNNVAVSVLNETGGREVPIYDWLSASMAYVIALYRHRPRLIERLRELIADYTKEHTFDYGTICENVKIINTGSIRNVHIGSFATIENTTRLENGTINSNETSPVYIGDSVIAQDFII